MVRYKYLEIVSKGFANHYRIKILNVLSISQNLSVEEITEAIGRSNYKTIAVHTYKLYTAGLIKKSYIGHTVQHSVTPLGYKVLKFLRNLELNI